MKRRLFFITAVLLITSGWLAFAAVPEKKGWWKFDDPSDMLKAEVGNALTLTGTDESVDGPVTGNKAVMLGTGSYLAMDHGFTAPVNEYTLMIDFAVPQLDGGFNAIFQTNPDNLDDAEFFINGDNKLGAWRVGYTENIIEASTWYRLVVSVKNGEYYRIYVNGALWLDGPAMDADSRDALQETLLLFADEDGEDKDIYCSEVAIWDVSLTAEEAAELGTATGTGVGIYQVTDREGDQLSVSPNPFSSQTTLTYRVSETGPVNISVIDFAGREVYRVSEGNRTPGDYTFVLSSEKLREGVYMTRMESSGHVYSCRILVLK